MPKVDDQQVAQEAAKLTQQPQQNAAQQATQQAQEKLRADTKDLVKNLRGEVGTDQEALDRLDQLDQKLDHLDSRMDASTDKELDPQLAEQLEDAVNGDPDAQRQLDEQTEKARENLADAQEQLKQTANDPTASDEQFLKDRAERDAATERFEQCTAAQARLKASQASQQAEREISQIREDLHQGMTAQQAMEQLHQMVDDAIAALEEEDRKKRISMEMTNGEIDL